MDKENIRTGDRAIVTMEFLFRPEYMVLGARLIFREGRTKGIGKVVGLHFADGTHKCLEDDASFKPDMTQSSRQGIRDQMSSNINDSNGQSRTETLLCSDAPILLAGTDTSASSDDNTHPCETE